MSTWWWVTAASSTASSIAGRLAEPLLSDDRLSVSERRNDEDDAFLARYPVERSAATGDLSREQRSDEFALDERQLRRDRHTREHNCRGYPEHPAGQLIQCR